MSVSTKIYLQPAGVIRRFTIDPVSFEEFDRIAKDAFSIKNNGLTYQWQYQDEEQDWVNFSTEGEWKDALYFHEKSKEKVMRLRLTQVEQGVRRPSTVRHWGIECDGCNQSGIIGIRYKCNDCPDFDYCSTCYESREKMMEHKEGSHTFTKIETPAASRCPAFHGNILNYLHRSCNPHVEKKEEVKPEPVSQPEPVVEQIEIEEPIEEVVAPVQQIVEEVKPVAPQPVIAQPVDMDQSWTFMELQNDPTQSQLQSLHANKPVVPQPVQPQVVPQPVSPQQPVFVAPQVVLPAPQYIEAYPQQMQTLLSMGFTNEKLNRHLLNNYKGELERVVGSLLNLTGYRN